MVIFWVKTNKTKKTPSQHSLEPIFHKMGSLGLLLVAITRRSLSKVLPRLLKFPEIGGNLKSLVKESCLSLSTMLKSMPGSLLPLPLAIERQFRKTDGDGSLTLATLHRTLIYFRLRQIGWPHCTGIMSVTSLTRADHLMKLVPKSVLLGRSLFFFLPCRARHDSSDGPSTSHTTSHTTVVISEP